MAYKHRMDALLLKMLTLCILLGKVLHIYHKGTIFVAEIKTNTNSKTKKLWQQKSMQQTLM